jgi:hypothetical protein
MRFEYKDGIVAILGSLAFAVPAYAAIAPVPAPAVGVGLGAAALVTYGYRKLKSRMNR